MAQDRLYEVVPYGKNNRIAGPLPRPDAIFFAEGLVSSNEGFEPVVCVDEPGTPDGGTVHVALRIRDLSLDDPTSIVWNYTVRPVERVTQGN